MLNQGVNVPKGFINDVEVANGPEDGVSALAFSPTAEFLAASSWDNKTRIWQVMPNGSSELKGMINHEAPVLCVAWSPDGYSVASGGCDKAARMMNLSTGQVTQVAAHDAPIKCIKYMHAPAMNSPILVTSGWDKSLKYWDTRSPTPIGTVALPEKAYCIDSHANWFVIGASNRKVFLFDINNPMTPVREVESSLKCQTRSIGMFKNKVGWAIGSVEGRVATQYSDPSDTTAFSFKCHRDDKNVYSVNSIAVHPKFDTFATSGSDGNITTWDKESRQRLKNFGNVNMPIPSICWSRDGSLLAYAVSYDWHKGYEGYAPGQRNAVFLHSVKKEEIEPRPKGVKR